MARQRSTELDYIDVEEFGIRLTLRQRKAGGPYHLDCAVGFDGERDRHSTGFRDRDKALEYAQEYIRRLVKHRLGDSPPSPSHEITLGELFDYFRKEPLKRMEPCNRQGYTTTLRVAEAIWGRDQLVCMIDQDKLDELVQKRRDGGVMIVTQDGKGMRLLGKTRQNTARSDYRHLNRVFNWGKKKITGPNQRLLASNPFEFVDPPAREKNPRTPITDQRRFSIMLAYADRVDPTGRLRMILLMARYTGRRRGSICALRCSDVLLDTERVRTALAERADEKFPESFADIWGYGALRWPEDADKKGRHWVVPIGPLLAKALRQYLATTPHPTVGDSPLFPGIQDLSKSVSPDVVGRWFRQAEILAQQENHILPHLTHGLWHPLRRLFRTEKKAAKFDTKDVFYVAGWIYTDPNTGNQGYLQPVAEDILEVVCHEVPAGPAGAGSHSRGHSAA